MIEIPLSMYIHFPWCIRKCPYCDFNSYELGSNDSEQAYIQVLLDDITAEAAALETRSPLHSIFMGGGTPSLVSAESISRVLDHVAKFFDLNPTCEITLEANPGATEQTRFRGYRQAGINRLSIGAQSFQEKFLKTLGRVHSAQQAIEAFSIARDAGFDNINIDLMHGLPTQKLQDAMADLEMANSLQSDHISWYQLTIEPNTYFHKFPPSLPDEDQLWTITQNGLDYLASAGYHRYETSAYARDGHRSAHNTNYWQFGDYVGVGAGAHGKLTSVKPDGHGVTITRTTRTRNPVDYLKNPNRRTQIVPGDALLLEFMMNALRLKDGFVLSDACIRTGLPVTAFESFINAGESRKLLKREQSGGDEVVKPTELGMRYLDDLLILI